MKVLFVCTGNTCRSPMAQGIAKNLFPQNEFLSAGIFAKDNSPASENAVIAMKNMGIDISEHKARQITKQLINEVDFIVPMTDNHLYTLLQAGVDKNKIKLCSTPVRDPFGQSLKAYEQTAKILKENIQKLIDEKSDN